MFLPDTPVTLAGVCFRVEVLDDEEAHRICVCTLALSPFTGAHADALNMRSLLFDHAGMLKESIAALTVNIAIPDQQLSLAALPESTRRIVLPSVRIGEKLRVSVKQDRDPVVCEATMKVSFLYPSPDVLAFVANAVADTLFATFAPEQRDLLTAEDDGEVVLRG
jgi:hypothetical protein